MDELTSGAAPVATESAPAPVSTPVEQTPAASIEDTMSQVWDKMNPKRDGAGQFASDNPVAEGADPAAEAAEKKIDQPSEAAQEPAKTSAIEAPNSWSAEMKAKFGALPPETQQYIAEREREAHQAITQKGEQIKAFEPIRQTLDQHREVFVKNGVSEAEGISKLLAADRFLDSNPAEAIKWLANSYGVDLRQFSTGNPQHDQSQPSSEVFQLRRELAEIKNSLTARERSEQQAQTATVAQTIEKFASENPYFNDVEDELMGMIPVIKAKEPGLNYTEVLKKAYDRAVYANPDVRQRLQADQQKAAEEKRKAEQAEVVRKAKQVGGINQKSVQGTTPTKGASMEDTMSQVYDRLMGNG